MKKILYEIVAANLNMLHREMITDYLKFNSYSRLDEDFIEKCGWTNKDFDEETLHRVDNNWN
jgi:hypothetical protein